MVSSAGCSNFLIPHCSKTPPRESDAQSVLLSGQNGRRKVNPSSNKEKCFLDYTFPEVFFKQQKTSWLQERPVKETRHLLAELLIA